MLFFSLVRRRFCARCSERGETKTMKSIAALSVASLLIGTSAMAQTSAPPEPDIVAATCSVCHGDDGVSPNARFPNLVAQTKDYLEAQLKSFRDHKRADPDAVAYMWPQAGALSEIGRAHV